MRKMPFIIIVILFIFCTYSCNEKSAIQDENNEIPEMKYGVELDKYFSEIGEIGNGDFFGPLLVKLGAQNEQIQKLIEESDGIFDITKIKIGNSFEALYDKIHVDGDTTNHDKGKLAYFIYERDALSHVLFSLKDSVYVKIVEKEIEEAIHLKEVTINNSLWNDVKAAGASPILALKLADVYAWTIDFFGLQKGDYFKVLYDELIYEGEVIDINNIYYVEFVHNGKQFYAIRFADGEKGNLYWNEKGESLRKAFLKAPLNFVRITSRFTYSRKHPVLKIVRPHTGVDYAAPKGTPVMTIGDGVVIHKGWSGGGGNTIKVKHNSIYTTSYMHLSGYAKGLQKGSRVKQGETIGYVGSTGLSTGPHLDFRVYKNGTPIDPLKMESPSVEPVSKSNMDAFDLQMQKYRFVADSLETNVYVDRILERLSPTE